MSNKAHAKRSPSTLESTILCSASAQMKEKYGKEESSVYTDEGSMLHEVVYNRLSGSGIMELEPLTPEQEIAVQDCIEYFRKVRDDIKERHPEASIYIGLEKSCDLTYLCLSECNGTADITISVYSDDTVIEAHVIDWKFGAGVEVSATKNPQLMAYMVGSFLDATHLISCPKTVMHVAQPRLDNYSTYETSGKELFAWVNGTLKPAIIKSYDRNLEFNPGEKQCRWCVGPKCTARHDHATTLAQKVFKDYARKPEVLDDETLSKTLVDLFYVADYIKDLKKHALSRAFSAEGFPGFKVVNGRSNRKWTDEDEATKFLKKQKYSDDVIYTKKLISCAQAEKLNKAYKKDPEFQSLIIKPPGAPTLVNIDDPRMSYKPATPQEAFTGHVKEG